MTNTFEAIVTGATGINGAAIINRLLEEPKCSKIHCVSRRLKGKYPSKVKHYSIDLITSNPEQIATTFQKEGVTNITYAFHTAYKEESDEGEACKTNGAMLRNFVIGLEKSNNKTLTRVVLTTGLKYYGPQLGEVRLPMEESDRRVPESFSGLPNFYYIQEDILQELSANKPWDYVIAMPSDICGVSQGGYMNQAFTIALYALVCKELDEPFHFPGNEKIYKGLNDISYSGLIADFEVWAAQKPETSNERFNIVNGDSHSWSRTWPKIADYFGLKIPKNQFDNWSSLSNKITLPTPPPIRLYQEEMGIKNIPNTEFINHISFPKWIQQDKVKKAWKQIAEREHLDPNLLDTGTWAFCDFTVGRTYYVAASMIKARQFGYHGYYDTFQGFQKTFDTLKREKVIPS
ncbi:epimarase [Schizosaccharomyces cryophilus OY26]|uniref:Epimarase n=1 Tax=Schizosaccharomyces cryophilus (strain OY26 / ATCC MYA-4695 / CBS 11777 / NBRC 106824 / NRRL Y48691) TaxID=653667 RepID=S9W3B0_SCHCR|nr:epimarase [Schizosaccharomyces cryophilus OY26]EPY53044.1 epimarase [Schizosaccharomyces cryophilus OY26]